ncbi:hypothetical protein BJ165DRAFT_1520547 [Panaeolus papilionaceus]|nr:hypothetical protein BJ165DRAFT_1520547 [Panaeolus papilionaceus]
MSTHSLSGEVDWAVVVTSGTGAELFRCSKPNLQKLDYNYSSLFIVEAKGPSEDLEDHIPQAIGEMYASARISGKTTIRGVISNGFSS